MNVMNEVKKATEKRNNEVAAQIMNECAKGAKSVKANAKSECKDIRSEATASAKALKVERLGVNATISFLARSESAEGAKFRDFFAIPKNANKDSRRKVFAEISVYLRLAKQVKLRECGEGDEIEVVSVNDGWMIERGTFTNDFLRVLAWIYKQKSIHATNEEMRLDLIKKRRELCKKAKEKGIKTNAVWHKAAIRSCGAIPTKVKLTKSNEVVIIRRIVK